MKRFFVILLISFSFTEFIQAGAPIEIPARKRVPPVYSYVSFDTIFPFVSLLI